MEVTVARHLSRRTYIRIRGRMADLPKLIARRAYSHYATGTVYDNKWTSPERQEG